MGIDDLSEKDCCALRILIGLGVGVFLQGKQRALSRLLCVYQVRTKTINGRWSPLMGRLCSKLLLQTGGKQSLLWGAVNSEWRSSSSCTYSRRPCGMWRGVRDAVAPTKHVYVLCTNVPGRRQALDNDIRKSVEKCNNKKRK